MRNTAHPSILLERLLRRVHHAHEQTVIYRQLFAVDVMVFQPIKPLENYKDTRIVNGNEYVVVEAIRSQIEFCG